MKLICIGDSLTYGYGVYRDQCWATLLSERLSFEVLNKGRNGDTSAGLLLRLYEDALQIKPAFVLAMIGTNDILMNCPLPRLQSNVKLLLEEIQGNNIVPVAAVQPPILAEKAIRYWDPYIDYERVYKAIVEYREWLKNYCSINGISVIDFYEGFMEKEDVACLYLDGIHLNAEGHKLMAELTADIFTTLIL